MNNFQGRDIIISQKIWITLLASILKFITRFGKERKGNLISEECKIEPGPGQYFQSDGFLYKIPKYSFAKEPKTKDSRPCTPGPGQYGSPHKISKEGPKYTVGKCIRTLSPKESQTLGPGSYTSGFYDKPRGPNTVIGKSKRDQSFIEELPGPGMYVPNISLKGQKQPVYR